MTLAEATAIAILAKPGASRHVIALRYCALRPTVLDWPAIHALEPLHVVRQVQHVTGLRVFVATELGTSALAHLPAEPPA